MAGGERRALVLAPAGKTGHLHQALGIAERLGAAIDVVEIPRAAAPVRLYRALSGKRPPVPASVAGVDIVIASGRQSLSLARWIARRPPPRPLVVALGVARGARGSFDLAWASAHDQPPADDPDLLVTLTTPARLSPAAFGPAAEALAPRVAHLPRPRVAVLVGGESRAYRFGATEAEELGAVLAGFAHANDASLLVTPSRRTGGANAAIIAEKLAGAPAWIWDGVGESPLAGMLGLARATIVTCDSVNMLSEAALTGRPVYAWPLPGGRAKFERFHAGLVDAGVMRWFDGSLEDWRYPPLDPAALLAAEIGRRLSA